MPKLQPDSSIPAPDHQTGLPGLGGTRDFQGRPLSRARPRPEPSDSEQAWSGRFAMIPEELVCSGNSLALAVYAALDRLSPNAHLYASLTRLCQITRLSEPTVRRAIQWLEAHKFLMVESLGTGRQPTGYLLPWKDRRAQGETSDTPGVNEIDPRVKRQTPQGETRLTPGVNDVSPYVSALRERREGETGGGTGETGPKFAETEGSGSGEGGLNMGPGISAASAAVNPATPACPDHGPKYVRESNRYAGLFCDARPGPDGQKRCRWEFRRHPPQAGPQVPKNLSQRNRQHERALKHPEVVNK